MTQHYFDNAATTKPCESALLALRNALENAYGNPSSLHRIGFDAQKLVTASRKSIASVLGCKPDELFFTSGATESNNLALMGAADAYKRAGTRIITCAIEHPSVRNTLTALQARGFEVITIAPAADGLFHAEDFASAVNDQTILISCMAVNNETGLILPIEQIATQCKRLNPKVLLHVDAVQAFTKLPLPMSKIDLLSISGHKIYAPKGIGALFVRKGVRVNPIVFGGGQENGLRSGTENVAGIAAFGAAALDCWQNRVSQLALYKELKTALVARLQKIDGITLNSSAHCVDYIVNLSANRIRSEVLLHELEQSDCYVSSGSACSGNKKSAVLTALGLTTNQIDSAIRVSFGQYNTLAEIDLLADALSSAVTKLVKVK